MPTPDRTSVDEIVRAGRDILEADGLAGLTMQAVAGRVGVRPPSLYKRVRNRDDLIGLITEATLRELGDRLTAVDSGDGSRTHLAAMARVLRTFAHTRPAGFALIFARRAEASRPAVETITGVVSPVLRAAAALVGEEDALAATRTITAWLYGFVSMELAGAFNLGGDVDEAFEFGLGRLIEALAGR